MRKRRVALAGILLVLMGAGFAVAGCSSDDSTSPETDTTAPAASGDAGTTNAADQDGSAEKAASAAKPNGSRPGQYVDYSPELVASTPGEKLLFFHADWCSQCQALEGDIEENGVPEGVSIFKVDYDSNQDLREEYGVTIQTTVVKVDDDGNKIDSYVAYDEPTLDNVTSALLE